MRIQKKIVFIIAILIFTCIASTLTAETTSKKRKMWQNFGPNIKVTNFKLYDSKEQKGDIENCLFDISKKINYPSIEVVMNGHVCVKESEKESSICTFYGGGQGPPHRVGLKLEVIKRTRIYLNCGICGKAYRGDLQGEGNVDLTAQLVKENENRSAEIAVAKCRYRLPNITGNRVFHDIGGSSVSRCLEPGIYYLEIFYELGVKSLAGKGVDKIEIELDKGDNFIWLRSGGNCGRNETDAKAHKEREK